MNQVAHITGYNLTTGLEEVFYFTSTAHLALNGQNYIPRIEQKLSYTEHLFDQGTTEGQGSVGIGNLVITNGDGALDNLISNYAFDGRTIKIYVFDDSTTAVTDSTTLYFSGIISHPEYGFDNVTFVIKNRMEALNVALQPSTFAGTNVGTGAAGGLEGQSSTIGGKAKPMLFGRCMSVEGTPVNDFFLMYAFNYDTKGNRKAVYKIYNVYVKGIQYLFCGDYTTAALLQAATIPTGYYATCLVEGLARLGSIPADNGSVVADVADAPEAGCTAGQVTSRIFDAAGFVAGTDYNGAALGILDAKNACPTGVFVNDTSTSIAATINSILSSVGAWFIPDGLGVFQFDILDTIANLQSGPSALNYASISQIPGDLIDPARTERVQTDNQSNNIPAYSVTLNHTKVWKTQDSGSLANAVTQTLRKFFGQDFRSSTAADTSIQTSHLLANALSFDTLLNQPIQASLQNGDFSVDLSGFGAGWTFGNVGTGNGALTQANNACVLTPTSGGACFIQQTLASPGPISPGSWQLMVTIPAKYAGQVIIAQGATGLWNQSYAASTNDQDLIIPFTMANAGTQSITVTLQTIDAVTPASFSGAVICQPILPTKPIYAGLINGNFNTALGTGWSFSNNAGGTGTGAVANSVCTLTPSGTGTCQVQQLLTPTAIWPGNWLFGVTVLAASSAAITIQQGATVLYNGTVAAGPTTVYLPFMFTATGTQSLTITIATINTSTQCKVSTALLCLNHVNTTTMAGILNRTFTTPITQTSNGWTFAGTGTGSYAQGGGVLTLTGGTGTAAVSQTLAIPAAIQAGNWLLKLTNGAGSGNATINLYQGTVLVGSTTIGPSATISLPFQLTSFGAGTLTIQLQAAAGVTALLSGLNAIGGIAGIAPTYAALVNGDFTQSAGTGWTFANDAGGTGTCVLSGTALLSPVTQPCSLSQTILAAGIPTGNWSVAVTLKGGYGGVVTILSGTTQLFSHSYVATDNDQNLLIPFVSTGSNITIVLGTRATNKANFSNCTVYSYSPDSITTFANLVNGNFSASIINLQAGWIFANAAGGTGIYSVANSAITLTPTGADCQVSQALNTPNAIFPGTWNLNVTVKANTTVTVTVTQGGVTLLTTNSSAASSTDTAFSLPFTASGSSPVVITLSTNGVTTTTLSNIYIALQTAGLSPLQEATRRLNIEKVLQERYTLDIPLSFGLGIKAGNVVTVLLDRFGMYGKDYLVIGREDDHDNETILLDVFRA